MNYSGIQGVLTAFVAVYPAGGGEPVERHTIELLEGEPTSGGHSFAPLPHAVYAIRLVADGAILDEVVIQVQSDTDGDGVADGVDGCPFDVAKTEGGACGCGRADDDTDGDGTFDCNDECPDDPGKQGQGICGCGTPDVNRDGDIRFDCQDLCPTDPAKIEPGLCGCGASEESCVVYEAEDASSLYDAGVTSGNAGYTGTGYVDYGGEGSFAEWNAIDGGSGGTFRIDLRYALLQSSRSCELLIDGERVATAAFRATGSWTKWGSESHEIQLTPGLHTLRIVANGGGGPNLDHFVLKLVGKN